MPYIERGPSRPTSIPPRRMHEEEWVRKYRPSFEEDGSFTTVSEEETDTWVDMSTQRRIWSAVGREIWPGEQPGATAYYVTAVPWREDGSTKAVTGILTILL